MPARAASKDDNWHGVTDAKKRKQIQDRLAQRARRRRLAEATKEKSSPGTTSAPPRTSTAVTIASPQSLVSNSSASSAPRLDGLSESNVQFLSVVTIIPSTDTNSTLPETIPAPITGSDPYSFMPALSDHFLISLPGFNICSALQTNGVILGMGCTACLPGKSLPPHPTTPLSLRASPIQQFTLHHMWIDRFPFVRFRDAWIKWENLVNQEDFVNDLLVTGSFRFETGKPCWDPGAWTMGREFAEKWGWLFFWREGMDSELSV